MGPATSDSRLHQIVAPANPPHPDCCRTLAQGACKLRHVSPRTACYKPPQSKLLGIARRLIDCLKYSDLERANMKVIQSARLPKSLLVSLAAPSRSASRLVIRALAASCLSGLMLTSAQAGTPSFVSSGVRGVATVKYRLALGSFVMPASGDVSVTL